MRELLTRLNIEDFNASQYIDKVSKNASTLPNIGIAVSGGGWRALMNGAGAIQAFDDRTTNATEKGHMGGLLQASTYLAGLSGGAWLVGSLFMNNFTTVTALRDDNVGSVWEFGNSVFEGPESSGIQALGTLKYYANLLSDVDGKRDAGFDLSLTDIWGRALSYQLINTTDGGASYTWSSIALSENFQNADTPFPIVIADERTPGQLLIPGNATIYEFNPFEMGTWDKTAYGFVPMEFLGTNFTAGKVPDGDMCVRGFDNAGYVMGTSSSLFNQFLLQVNSSALSDGLKDIVNNILEGIGADNNDIADYTPNPFYQYHPESNPAATSKRLTLVDGGEDLENIPLHPLIQPTRHLDVIFAIDSSADTNYFWPNGTSLVASYERSHTAMTNGTAFPSIPDVNTFVNLGLNFRPTFFGCNTTNMSSGGIDVPLIVYLPNSPYVAGSNFSTFRLETNNTIRDKTILNGYNTVTMGNGTVDDTWSTCVACAILSRSWERTKTEIPDACTTCFDKFCWDGTLNSTQPAEYNPKPHF